ncbi:uncharacterized protein LOC115041595 [Echeneis naucrates]|uniref:Uncharacterized LOC115041595 n=1 Tax=Echeneis naucrates TaxID=173247 RepID=A0A665T5F8_ECHNA|nr:uncharacterized protein LOC115041595 [Echeneis naucrates]
MSAEASHSTEPLGSNATVQGTTVGGSKPLHRFIKGQPKTIGVIVLILGTSFFIISIVMKQATSEHFTTMIPPGFLLGILYIMCGILYVLTEHNPTKKTVTISLALSIVTILGLFWSILQLLPGLIHGIYYRHVEFLEDNMTEHDDPLGTASYETMAWTLEAIFLFYSLVGVIIFITMSVLAGAALRSTKSQAIVMMTVAPNETPVE